jgi:hypothetical protein
MEMDDVASVNAPADERRTPASQPVSDDLLDTGRRRLRLLGAALGGAVATGTDRIEELHRGIARRAFDAAGPGARPAQVTHDAVAAASYAAVRRVLRGAGQVAGAVAAASPLSAHPRVTGREAGLVEGAISGIWGDHIERRHPDLAVRMAVRSGGRDVSIDGDALAATFPHHSRRLAVFLHGLAETEDAWGRPAQDDDQLGTYGDRLQRQLGLTPIFIRYNSGLHVSENGARLAELLEALIDAWPLPVDDLAMVGHSMGGLVVRSACDAGVRDGLRWVTLVRHCVYLGTPHDGAQLERGVNMLAGTLRLLPETRPLATLLDVRSAGVKDLRFGYVRQEDWNGHDPDRVLVDTGQDVQLLSTARHHVVAATIGETPHHVLSRILGDLLVHHGSASGHGRRGVSLQVEASDRRHLGGLHHFHLLDHPAVAEMLHEWMNEPAPARSVS